MLQFIMDQNLLLYICGVACAVGVVSQFLLRHLYERLTGEIQDTGGQKKTFLRQLQQRFQNCVHLNEKIRDISAFADRSMMDYRFLRMNLHQWSRLAGEALAVCLLCCGAGLWVLYRSGGDISLQTSYSLAGIMSLLLIGASYGMADNRYRHMSLKVRLMDYLQNSGALKDYREVEFPASVEEGVGKPRLRRQPSRRRGRQHQQEAALRGRERNQSPEGEAGAEGRTLQDQERTGPDGSRPGERGGTGRERRSFRGAEKKYSAADGPKGEGTAPEGGAHGIFDLINRGTDGKLYWKELKIKQIRRCQRCQKLRLIIPELQAWFARVKWSL